MRKSFAWFVVAFLIVGSALAVQPVDRVPGNAMVIFPNVQHTSFEGVTRIPSWVHGDLGTLPRGQTAAAAVAFMDKVSPVFDLRPGDSMRAVAVVSDDLGMRHVRLHQFHDGIPVDGGDVYLHVDSSGVVRTINGHLGAGITQLPVPRISGQDAEAYFAERLQVKNLTARNTPTLVYYTRAGEATFLAWRFNADWSDASGVYRERIYIDADDGTVLDRQSLIWSALNRRIYTANHGTSLPGTLLFTEGGSSSDSAAMGAYNNSGNTYNFYKTKFNRDSYDNSGATLYSTVHYSNNYNNAYWDGSQMVYGDGDGSLLSNLSLAQDVVAHELTHAVTEHTANLNYSNESGALNEAWSDIFGASVEAWVDGGVNSNTWKIGEECYTPNTAGDALRYMNDPTADGQSYDYYPERYTGSQDNGGVHLNSGIANLAFYLLSQGGTHPRNKTSVTVPAIGIDKADAIFYRALTNYMTASTNFQGARDATAQAATDLYGTTEYNAVEAAWDAVGVPGGGGGGGGSTVTDLQNGVAVSGLSGSTGSWTYFKIAVPSGQASLVIQISGGSGDCDLYVKRGSQPTSSSYDYRPYLNGNAESVTVTNPASGDWYIGLNAYSTFSSVTLVATYSDGGGGGGGGGGGVTDLSNGVAVTGLSGAKGADAFYKIAVPAGQTSLEIKIWGGSGDCDLYVKRGSQPTTSSYDYRPYLSGNNETVTVTNPTSGDWYVMLHGYAAYSGMSLQATYTDGGGGGGGGDGVTVLTNGVPVTNLSGSQGADDFYKIAVPSGVSGLEIAISGGSGDCDLYVKRGSQPTTSSYDYRPYLSGNNETVSVSNPTSGDWYIMLHGYASYSGMTLVATYTAGGGGGSTSMNESESNNSTSSADTIASSPMNVTGYISSSSDVDYYKLTLAAGHTLTLDMSVPSGKDYDVKFYNSSGSTLATGQNGTGQAEHVTYTASSGMTVYIKVYPYSGSSTSTPYTLDVTF